MYLISFPPLAPGLEVIYLLNSMEHYIFILLINVNLPTMVGLLTFITG